MKRLIGGLFVVAILAASASSVQAGGRFSPLDRLHSGRVFYLWRHAPQVSVVQSPAATNGETIRSFSFEPDAAPAAPAVMPHASHHSVNRLADRLWARQHSAF